MPIETSEVLIAGAGPTGLMMAAQLLRWGIRPRIIDAKAGPSLQTKALAVQARTLEIFRQMGVADAALAEGWPARGVNLFGDRGRLGRVPLGDIGTGLSPFPYMLVIGQDRTERILGELLAAQGLEIEWGTRLEAFSVGEDRVQAVLSRDGRMEAAEFRYLLGADGPHSTVRHGLGIDFEGDTYDHRFFVADLRVEGEAVEGELNIFLSNRFHVLALFPMTGGRRFRLVGIFPEALHGIAQPTFDDLQPHLRQIVGERMRFGDVSWFSIYRVHHRVAQRFQRGPCFLLGDAAHIHSPVGGQGMNTGLQDAYNLAWKLALVLRGAASPRLLETYQEERRPFATLLVETTDRAFSAVVSRGPMAQLMRQWLIPAMAPRLLRLRRFQHLAFRAVSQTALNYRGARLSVDRLGDKVRAGDRFPWFHYSGGDVFDLFSGTRFTLLALGDWQGRRAELDALRSDLIEPAIIPERAAYAAAGLADGVYLVRPDGYIGLCTEDLDAAAIRSYLSQMAGIGASAPRLATLLA